MMTPLQKQKVSHYFNVLDFDKNGVLERDDFINIGENLCVLWGFREGTEEYNACIQRCEGTWQDFCDFMEKPYDSTASLAEWLEFADKVIVNGDEELYERHINKLAKEIIGFFDTNQDGYISLNEYVDLFMAYRIEIRYSAKAFTKLDLDHDDYISADELLSAIREFFRSDDENAKGNWLFGFWESYRN